MGKKVKTKELNTSDDRRTAQQVEPQEAALPDFVFMGTDGEFYLVGQTPHSLIRKLLKQGVSYETFGYDQLDDWLYEHLRVVPDQRHLTLEQVQDLYFEIDIPLIFDFICRRVIEAKASVAQAVEVLNKRAEELREMLKGNEDGKETGPAHPKRKASRKRDPK